MPRCEGGCCGRPGAESHAPDTEVTAWHLIAHYGTGGLFRAKMQGGFVEWTDARLPVGREADDIVVVGRVLPNLKVIERRVRAGARFILLEVME